MRVSPLRKYLRRAAGAILIAAALTGTSVLITAGSAQAAVPSVTGPAFTALDEGEWHAPPASSAPPNTKCSINATATAFLVKVEQADGNLINGLTVQTDTDIHNPYVFVGCTIRVYVDVIDKTGVTLWTVQHDAFAGAWFDPQGNNKAYNWIDTKVMPQPRLD